MATCVTLSACRKLFGLIGLFILFPLFGQSQSVGINQSGASPDPSAMLDVVASDKGVLIPRVSLNDTATQAPISAAPVEGLMIYNISGSEPTGFYYWEGAQWIRFSPGSHTNKLSVSPTTDIQTTSSTWVDMGGMSITFTPDRSTVHVHFSASGTYSGTPTAQNLASFRVLVNGTQVRASGVNVGIYDDFDGYVNGWSAVIDCPVSVTPGNSTTIKVQWRYDSEGGGARTLHCIPTTDPEYQFRSMLIYD
ncbi:MAG: hypothetical protein ABEH38_06455 [Flavobacteriales bacterium]